MAILNKQHNFIWYGVCGSDETSPKSGKGTNANGNCSDYTLVNIENILEVHLISGNTNQTWKKDSDNNDFNSLICGNAYYIKLEVGLDNNIQELTIPHAIHSAQNYKIAECETPTEVNNNVYLNATGSATGGELSGQLVYDETIVMELEVANEEQINGGDGIDVDSSVKQMWNLIASEANKITEQTTFDKTKHIIRDFQSAGGAVDIVAGIADPDPTTLGEYVFASTDDLIDALHEKAVFVIEEVKNFLGAVTGTKIYLKGSIRLPYTKLKPTSDTSARILNDFFTNVQSTQVDQFIISSSSATGDTPHSLATMDIKNSFKTENLNLICDNLSENQVSIGVKYLQHDQADFEGTTTPVTSTYSIVTESGALDAGKPWEASTCVYANAGGTGIKLNSKPKVEILEMFIYSDDINDKKNLPICNGE